MKKFIIGAVVLVALCVTAIICERCDNTETSSSEQDSVSVMVDTLEQDSLQVEDSLEVED